MIVQAAFITRLSVTCKCGHNNIELSVLSLCAGVISTFLHVHPFGANIEYLWSYIQRLDAKVIPFFISFIVQSVFIGICKGTQFTTFQFSGR